MTNNVDNAPTEESDSAQAGEKKRLEARRKFLKAGVLTSATSVVTLRPTSSVATGGAAVSIHDGNREGVGHKGQCNALADGTATDDFLDSFAICASLFGISKP